MILLLGSLYPPLMLYARGLGKELNCYKVTNYLIADHAFAMALQECKMDQFIEKLIEDIPRRLCIDKRERLSLRNNVRMSNSYYNELEIMELRSNAA